MRHFCLLALLAGCDGYDPGGIPLDAGGDGAQHCLAVHDAGGPFVSSSTRTVWEEEPHVAAAAGSVVASFIDIFPDHNSSIGFAVSHDDGATWKKPGQIDSPGARVASDPVVAADSHGTFYLSWVGYRHDTSGNANDMHVYVSKLDPTTDAFLAPVEASNGESTLQLDKPWITIDTNDDVLLTWEDGTNGNFLQFARSTDQGATFARSVIAVASGEFFNLAFPCLDRAAPGPLYVVASASQHGVVLFESEDGGAHFTRRPEIASDAVFHDPTCVVRGSDVWVSYDVGSADYTAELAPPARAVRVAHSPDRGQSIDRNVTVSNGPSGTQYNLSTLAFSGNALELLYYQGHIDFDVTLERATSTDNGVTWMHETLAHPGVMTTARGLPCFPGDYIGSTITGGALYIAYSDNNAGRVHTAFLRVTSP